MKQPFWASPDFARFAPWIRIEPYTREGGGTSNPRNRLELAANAPSGLTHDALKYAAACVACGRRMQVFRPRRAWTPTGGWSVRDIYLAVACPLNVSIGCSRGKGARDAYVAIAAIAKAAQVREPQGTLQ